MYPDYPTTQNKAYETHLKIVFLLALKLTWIMVQNFKNNTGA